MPFLMLAKCAEAQAIRKGWPEDLSNTFVGEETDRAALNLQPAEAAAQGATLERLERIGAKDALIIDWLDDAPLDAVPLGKLADRIVAFLRERRGDTQALISWRDRNRHALREFWARAPADALGVTSPNARRRMIRRARRVRRKKALLGGRKKRPSGALALWVKALPCSKRR